MTIPHLRACSRRFSVASPVVPGELLLVLQGNAAERKWFLPAWQPGGEPGRVRQ
jgi:hypothetical protein